MGDCVVNGKSYNGNNITISGGQIIIDGEIQSSEDLSGEVSIVVHGDVGEIELGAGKINCEGVGDISTSSGDVTCGNVSGSIRTSSGDVECGSVGGKIRTSSGDVCHR